METNKIIHGDCIEELKKLPEDSIDLIVIDPPYNIGYDSWDKIPNYLEWIEGVCKELKRVLKHNGSLYIWNSSKFVAEIKCIFSNNGFVLNSWCVWNKKSKAQNSTRSYTDLLEHCLFFTFQDESGLSVVMGHCVVPIRDYIRSEIIRAKGKIVLKDINVALGTASNGGGVASACLSLDKSYPTMMTEEHYQKLREWLNKGEEYEYLRKEYEELRKEYEELRKEYEELRYTFNYIDIGKERNPKDKRTFSKEVTNPINVWEHQNTHELHKIKHLTPKPLELIKKIILASSNNGDVVLDCFLGSGTTAVACQQTGRKFIGIEKEEEYCKIARERLAQKSLL